MTAGPACPGLPPDLTLTGNGRHRVFSVTRYGSTAVATVPIGVVTKAVRGRDGTIWAEARDYGRPNSTTRRIFRFDTDGNRRVSETGEVRLSHVGTVRGGASAVTYIDRDGFDPDQETRGNVFVEYASGARRSLTHASGIEHWVSSAAPAVGPGGRRSVIVLGGFADLGEFFTYRRPDGTRVRRLFDPNRPAVYSQPPLHFAPVLSPDGVKLSYTEGPDWSQERSRLVGDWRLVTARSRMGANLIRVKVGRLGEELHHADYDGRYWVGTFSKRMDRAPKPSELRIRIVDTLSISPHPMNPGCSLAFVASIDRFVSTN